MNIEVKYQCQHLTCRIARCYEGVLILDKTKFDMYRQTCTESGCFVSPSSFCKLGHIQTFKIIETKNIDNNSVQMVKRHEATIEEKKEKTLEATPVPTVISINDSIEERLKQAEELYNRITGHCDTLVNEQKQKIGELEQRIVKLEQWRKGSKVSRKEE